MFKRSATWLHNIYFLGPSNLTVEALEKHNADVIDDDNSFDTLSNANSIGGFSKTSIQTWATHLTDCTNATFSKVHARFDANASEHQREVSLKMT